MNIENLIKRFGLIFVVGILITVITNTLNPPIAQQQMTEIILTMFGVSIVASFISLLTPIKEYRIDLLLGTIIGFVLISMLSGGIEIVAIISSSIVLAILVVVGDWIIEEYVGV